MGSTKGESPRSLSRGLDPNDPELQKQIRYTREKKEQLKALLGTSRRQPPREEPPVVVTTYTTIRPSNDSAATDISEGTSSQSHLIKPGGSSSVPSLCPAYPYKPARCKSYIVETDPETPLLPTSASFTTNSQNAQSAPSRQTESGEVRKTEDLSQLQNSVWLRSKKLNDLFALFGTLSWDLNDSIGSNVAGSSNV